MRIGICAVLLGLLQGIWGMALPLSLPQAMRTAGQLQYTTSMNMFQDIRSLVFKSAERARYQETDFKDGNSSHCLYRLGQMGNHFLTDPGFAHLLQYSSKGLNEIGDYDACSKLQPAFYYFKMAVVMQGMPLLHVGLCLPQECTVEVMEKVREYMLPYLSELMQMNLTADQVPMANVADTNRRLNHISVGCVVCLSISAILVMTIIVASVCSYWDLLPSTSKELWVRLLSCFSLQRNLRGILSTENRIDPKLEVLNGVRVLSIGWVVFGHCFAFVMFNATLNPNDYMEDAQHGTVFTVVKAGTVSVDVFFFLSGFLAALGLLRAFNNPQNRSVKNVLMIYFHRYVRLLPLVLVMMLYTMYIQAVIYDTPNNFGAELNMQLCKEQWHYTLLYINNFVNDFNKMCDPWVWYLFIDMQLFLFMPFIILLYLRSRKGGLLTILFICIASLIAQIGICAHYHFHLSYFKQTFTADSNTIVYGKPYCRLLPYFIGVVLYLLYEEGKDQSKCPQAFLSIQGAVQGSRVLRCVLYTLGFGLMTLTVYSFYYLDNYLKDWGEAFGIFHMISCRPLFILALCAILYPVLVGKGRLFLAVLGHPVLNPLGKLTYGNYIFHLQVYFLFIASLMQGTYYQTINPVVDSFGLFFVSYIVSLIATLIYESPVVQLLKTFLERAPPKPSLKPKVVAEIKS